MTMTMTMTSDLDQLCRVPVVMLNEHPGGLLSKAS